jgi:hypothetical protein
LSLLSSVTCLAFQLLKESEGRGGGGGGGGGWSGGRAHLTCASPRRRHVPRGDHQGCHQRCGAGAGAECRSITAPRTHAGGGHTVAPATLLAVVVVTEALRTVENTAGTRGFAGTTVHERVASHAHHARVRCHARGCCRRWRTSGGGRNRGGLRGGSGVCLALQAHKIHRETLCTFSAFLIVTGEAASAVEYIADVLVQCAGTQRHQRVFGIAVRAKDVGSCLEALVAARLRGGAGPNRERCRWPARWPAQRGGPPPTPGAAATRPTAASQKCW